MRIFGVLLLLFPLFVFAQIVMPLQKGWQLVGLPQDLENLEQLNNSNVIIIWSFDASTQSWRAYSPDTEIQTKLKNKNILTIDSLKANHGFWINSAKEWVLEFEKQDQISTEEKTLDLLVGWNLLSLPIGTSISPHFFEQQSVWKYSKEREWQHFDPTQTNTLDQKMRSIENNDGIWIYSQEQKTISLNAQTMQMKKLNSIEEIEALIEEMLLHTPHSYYGCFDAIEPALFTDTQADQGVSAPTVGAPENAQKVDDASSTNIQELGVDEADILKHDNTHIFYLDAEKQQILISSFTSLLSGNNEALYTLNLQQDIRANALYLQENTLVVLYSGSNSFYPLGEGVANYTNSLRVTFYDISDLTNITQTKNYTIDGTLYSSRLIDSKLYLFSSFTPQIELEYPKIYLNHECQGFGGEWSSDAIACHQAYFDGARYYRYDYTQPKIKSKKLLPQMSGTSKALIEANNFYAPAMLEQSANITTISSFDLTDASFDDALSFLGESSTLYGSATSLYITSHRYPYYYDFFSYKEQTVIYKIALDPLEFRAKGFVDGRILNQFSLSEHNNTLRIATTQGYSWQEDTNNTISTLQEHDSTLVKVGILGDLGKKAEEIKAVRFMGDIGFLVTFRQTDPLYTLDLSNPFTPQKIGELHIDGFSEYLHPVNETQLLALGRDADSMGISQGLALSLFDISDLSSPRLLDKYSFGTSSSHSEAEYNHKALSYLDAGKLFGLPFSYDYHTRQYNYYKIKDDAIQALGSMQAQPYGSHYDTRGIFFQSEGIYHLLVASDGKFYYTTLEE